MKSAHKRRMSPCLSLTILAMILCTGCGREDPNQTEGSSSPNETAKVSSGTTLSDGCAIASRLIGDFHQKERQYVVPEDVASQGFEAGEAYRDAKWCQELADGLQQLIDEGKVPDGHVLHVESLAETYRVASEVSMKLAIEYGGLSKTDRELLWKSAYRLKKGARHEELLGALAEGSRYYHLERLPGRWKVFERMLDAH